MKRSASARVSATICGLILGPLTLIQYTHLGGFEPLWWLHLHQGPGNSIVRAMLAIVTLLVTSISFQRACRDIGTLPAGAWFAAGSGIVLLLLWISTLEATRPWEAGDMRDVLRMLVAPTAIICLLVLLIGQAFTLFSYAPPQTEQPMSRGLSWEVVLLALISVLIGLGPFRWQIGEWHYLLALLTGDAACIGFLAISRREFLLPPETRKPLVGWAAGAIGVGMIVFAVGI